MKFKKSFGEKIADIIIFLIMFFVITITLYPFIYVVGMSINKNSLASMDTIFIFPKAISFHSYKTLFADPLLWKAYFNTIWYVTFGTVINVVLTMLGGYVLAQKRFFLRRKLNLFIIITMYFSGGLIPTFMLINKLGMYNTRWALIIPGAVSAFYVIIARTFIESNIPESLYESARIEGANDIGILLKIVIPLSMPIIAVLSIYYGVGHWNSYFGAMIYLQDRNLHPLQMYLIDIVVKNSSRVLEDLGIGVDRTLEMMQIKYAVIVVSILPVLLIYPFVQKYFVKGVLIGAVKE